MNAPVCSITLPNVVPDTKHTRVKRYEWQFCLGGPVKAQQPISLIQLWHIESEGVSLVKFFTALMKTARARVYANLRSNQFQNARILCPQKAQPLLTVCLFPLPFSMFGMLIGKTPDLKTRTVFCFPTLS